MFEPSEETLRLQTLIEDAPDGAFMTYAALAEHAAIPMNVRGKGMLRTAVKRANRAYRVDPGIGIELDAPGNAMGIVTVKTSRVSGALKRAHQTSSLMSGKHLMSMEAKDRDRLSAMTSLLGAIDAMSNGFSKIYSRKPEALNEIKKIPLPWEKP